MNIKERFTIATPFLKFSTLLLSLLLLILSFLLIGPFILGWHGATNNNIISDYDNYNDVQILKTFNCNYASSIDSVYQTQHLSQHSNSKLDYDRGFRIINKIEYADPASFRIIKNDEGYCYAGDTNSIYFTAYGSSKIFSLKNIDTNSFQVLDDMAFARDTDTLYFRGQEVLDADPETFSIKWSKASGATYAVDNDGLYFINHLYDEKYIRQLPDINLENIEYFPSLPRVEPSHDMYAYDLNTAYFRDIRIPVNDMRYFEILTSLYSKDNINVYYRGKILPTADVDSVEVVGLFVKDKHNVFCYGEILEGADITSFEKIPYAEIFDYSYPLPTYRDKYKIYRGCQGSFAQ